MHERSDLHESLLPSPVIPYHSLRISVSRLLIKALKMQNTLDHFFCYPFPCFFKFSSISSLLGSEFTFQFPASPRPVVPRGNDFPRLWEHRCIPLGQQRHSFPQAPHYVWGTRHQRPGAGSRLQHGTVHKSPLPQPEFRICYKTQRGGEEGGNLLRDRPPDMPRLVKGSVPADLSAGPWSTQ